MGAPAQACTALAVPPLPLLLLQYYDTPNLSLRAAAYHLMRRGIGNF